MFLEYNTRVRIVKLENPMLPKALLGLEGIVEEPVPESSGLWYVRSPFYWVRLIGEHRGYFCASVAELELIA